MIQDTYGPFVWAVAALLWLLVANLISIGLFWHDKRRARMGGWRIPEKVLLLWALVGGWFGARYGQHRFRHKTRKQPFATLLAWIPAVWALLILGTGLYFSGTFTHF